ncbi:NAD(P)-dependent alcohol dehydrogenase [Bifidobacterium sp. ESL0784]|uniref:NAD(P)-dependent alcohol dehydrogenase n=1 Tax=Bifidobacterium sp. ESL0784 TaxID=2983231 RepID=UPI0023F702F1|nr:NAD(P)-dependent alcohol dehydrogenase [Bifidobacterium sp. ESL0784]MDF7640151.1 NAD(P)-dependent alcohol dehydrogenase [Bifidobacterium sp. ESL0784]
MKAVIYTKSGDLDGLKIQDAPTPTPNDDQVLIRVKACALNVLEFTHFTNKDKQPSLFSKLTDKMTGVLGHPLGGEVAGIVERIGADVKGLKAGDEVFGVTPGSFPIGGLAEYAVLDKNNVALKPANLSFAQAASATLMFETALGALRKAKVKSGDQVLIYGASGGVGQYTVQIAKAMGAEVTGVCSTRNIELAKEMGCTQVIDYRTKDFRKTDARFDAVLAVNGSVDINDFLKMLKPNGVLIPVGQHYTKAIFRAPFNKHIATYAQPMAPQKDYLQVATKLANAGKLAPHIDHVWPASEAKQAFEYALTQHVQGKIVIATDFSE